MIPSFQSRVEFGAVGEPSATVLHGAGQDAQSFADYSALFVDQHTKPALYMAYLGLRGLRSERLRALARELETFAHPKTALQLGLSMTHDGQPENHYEHEVAAGLHDAALEELCAFLASLRRQIYVRIGYEANGPWNGYAPETYVAAFRHVAARLRAAVPGVAIVWCIEGGFLDNYHPYDPGDEWADWWSIDLFSTVHLQTAAKFLEEATERKKPVMIGECTPRRVGVEEGEESWSRWFAPFFALIRDHGVIKAFCYINWNWAGYPQWQDWGNARIQDHSAVLQAFREEMRSPLYVHLTKE